MTGTLALASTEAEKQKLLAALPPETLKYKDYFDCQEPVKSIPSHRLLAIRRGAAEGVLMFHIAPPEPNGEVILDQMGKPIQGPLGTEGWWYHDVILTEDGMIVDPMNGIHSPVSFDVWAEKALPYDASLYDFSFPVGF
jgi:hypothetical protein